RRIRLSDNSPNERAMAEEYRAKGFNVEPDMCAANTTVVSLPTKDVLMEQVENLHGDKADEIVQSDADVSLTEMLAFQRMYHELWAANAVSYTVNFDPAKYAV